MLRFGGKMHEAAAQSPLRCLPPCSVGRLSSPFFLFLFTLDIYPAAEEEGKKNKTHLTKASLSLFFFWREGGRGAKS